MNYLEPIPSYLFAHNNSHSYGILLRKLLFKNHKNDWIKMVVLPSFRCEYMFSLKQKNDNYYIQASKTNKQIYSNKNLKNKEITNRLRECSTKMAHEIKKLWCDVLLKTCYPKKAFWGYDGVSYYFSAFFNKSGSTHPRLCDESVIGWVEGKTWSPEKGLPFDMVKIGNSCFSYAYDRKTSEEEIINLIIKTREKHKIAQHGT